ncbi:thermonuclease family protein [Ornithinimicrobium panacihumi]|uniref:thermonuclease family protein n=1 Tax=Ornithinimicrobium panacihumi TaxID=2008449 RepID=UPI003F8BE5B8
MLDGDTFTATDAAGDPVGRVRLVGVDAPELTQRQCWSQDATNALRQLVITGTRVELTVDPGQGERDHYGRLLGYVRTTDAAGLDVSLQLLEHGHARPWGQHPRRQAYEDAAEEAADPDVGVWGACR